MIIITIFYNFIEILPKKINYKISLFQELFVVMKNKLNNFFLTFKSNFLAINLPNAAATTTAVLLFLKCKTKTFQNAQADVKCNNINFRHTTTNQEAH